MKKSIQPLLFLMSLTISFSGCQKNQDTKPVPKSALGIPDLNKNAQNVAVKLPNLPDSLMILGTWRMTHVYVTQASLIEAIDTGGINNCFKNELALQLKITNEVGYGKGTFMFNEYKHYIFSGGTAKDSSYFFYSGDYKLTTSDRVLSSNHKNIIATGFETSNYLGLISHSWFTRINADQMIFCTEPDGGGCSSFYGTTYIYFLQKIANSGTDTL
jgi:hypothetical protein